MNNSLKKVMHDTLRSAVQKSVNSYVGYSSNAGLTVSYALGNAFNIIGAQDLYSILERTLADD